MCKNIPGHFLVGQIFVQMFFTKINQQDLTKPYIVLPKSTKQNFSKKLQQTKICPDKNMSVCELQHKTLINHQGCGMAGGISLSISTGIFLFMVRREVTWRSVLRSSPLHSIVFFCIVRRYSVFSDHSQLIQVVSSSLAA